MPGLEPLYPLSAGLSQKVARKTMLEALKSLPELPEWQDAALMEKQNWPRWAQAILMLHSPEYKEDMSPSGRARSRLAYDELFAKQLALPAGLMVQAVTGRDKGKPREALATGMREGYIDVVVGTHALFQEKVEFKNLGLVIIDEQHRFGVHDRMKLSEKGQRPDLLVMTATPIPRTLALTSYGDLDISKLDEKPAGRKPIDTRILPLTRLDDMIDAMGRALKDGGRAYWVCPLVEDSEFIDLSSVEDRHRQLTAIFGDRVGLLHGRMKPAEKEAVALAFKNGEFDILVAT